MSRALSSPCVRWVCGAVATLAAYAVFLEYFSADNLMSLLSAVSFCK